MPTFRNTPIDYQAADALVPFDNQPINKTVYYMQAPPSGGFTSIASVRAARNVIRIAWVDSSTDSSPDRRTTSTITADNSTVDHFQRPSPGAMALASRWGFLAPTSAAFPFLINSAPSSPAISAPSASRAQPQ